MNREERSRLSPNRRVYRVGRLHARYRSLESAISPRRLYRALVRLRAARHPSIHPHVCRGNEWEGPRVSEGLGKPGGDGLATRSAFHPPSQCTYMCISTSRSRRFVSVQGGEETIEERPVADSRGSNGSTWFPAGNWVREVIGYTLFVADIKRDKLCKYFPLINEFLSKESRYSRMGFREKDSSRVKLFFVE